MAVDRRILLATWNGAGNNPPIVSLAAALVSSGDDVHVLGHESTRRRFQAVGCSFIPWENSADPPFIRRFMPPEEEAAYTEEHLFFSVSFQLELRSVIEGLAPDVVMADVLLMYAILEGLRGDLPLVVLCHILYSLAAAYPDVDRPQFSTLQSAAVAQGVAPFASRREMLDLADLVLVFAYADFDPLSGAEAGSNVFHAGPLRSPSDGVSEWVRHFPGRPLVVIALSTSDMNQSALLQRLCDACAMLDVEALVTTGPSIEPQQLVTSENVTAVSFISHDLVLPQADLLITHAGHGTVAAGLASGVPMLCIPLGRDQPANADRVQALQLGVVLERNSPTDALRQAIAELLNDDDITERSERMSHSLRVHPGIEETLHVIDKTIRT